MTESWNSEYDRAGGTAAISGLWSAPPVEEPEPLDPIRDCRSLGFEVVGELGKGSFGQVFLARQGDLADRHVVLKFTADLMSEPDALAQLCHANIVPIYSLHHVGANGVICMPYLGPTTLDDVRKHLPVGRPPASGVAIADALERKRLDTAGPCRSEPDPALLDRLRRKSFVDAVLWIGSGLADGLTHAHERGILHRDMKPANILITNEGQPMLLDFNLASDSNSPGSSPRFGGSFPYMAPEQLETMRAAREKHASWAREHGNPEDDYPRITDVDARTDVYSLGVILWELLAGRAAFPVPRMTVTQAIPLLLGLRWNGPPSLRAINPDVTPAVEAIIRKATRPNPADRYQSAAELKDDLDRQLSDRPLKYAPNRSVRERFGKWRRRNPQLVTVLMVTTLALATLGTMAGVLYGRQQAIFRHESTDRFEAFADRKRSAEVLLFSRTPSQARLQEGRDMAVELLGRYRVLDDPDWATSEDVAALTAGQQAELRQHVGELLFLLARATERLNANDTESVRDALDLNARAAGCYADGDRPWALKCQAVSFRRQLDPDAEIPDVPFEPRSARDRYLRASDLAALGECREAERLANQAVRSDSGLFPAWFLLGNCRLEREDYRLAEGAFSVCIALEPDSFHSWHNRGLARYLRHDFAGAIDDFDRAIELRPDGADPYIDRALARKALDDFPGAVADLTLALGCDDAPTRIYFIRSRMYAQLGDGEAARRDFDKGMETEPADAKSWVSRGMARLADDPKAALADFEQALKADPECRSAMQNKAHVLAERLENAEAGLAVLDRLLEVYPESSPALGGRAVLRARLGRRDDALADATACLDADLGPTATYQVAGVYALTSRTHPEDRDRAMRLLSSALSEGYGLRLVATDSDLDPIREDPEFRRLVSAAKFLESRNRESNR